VHLPSERQQVFEIAGPRITREHPKRVLLPTSPNG
jgi:hypothetical protein